jgi:hypothetical protein
MGNQIQVEGSVVMAEKTAVGLAATSAWSTMRIGPVWRNSRPTGQSGNVTVLNPKASWTLASLWSRRRHQAHPPNGITGPWRARQSHRPLHGGRRPVKVRPRSCRTTLGGNQGRLAIAAAGGADRRPARRCDVRGPAPAQAQMIVLEPHGRSSKEVPVSIVGGLDVHRRQITFAWVDRASPARPDHPGDPGGLAGGWPSCPTTTGVGGGACTGWRFVVEELRAVGWQPYLAEPAETAPGWPKRRARPTGPTPSCWGAAGTRPPAAGVDPPAHLLELRVLAAGQDPGRSAHRLQAAAARGAVSPRPACPTMPC